MKIAQFAMVIVLSVLMSACSNKIVKTYEGEALAKTEVAILIAGENIELISVNGKRVPKYLLTNLETKYGLKPGLNQVVFQYSHLWGKALKGDDGARSELVSSGPQLVEVDAKLGETYRFEYDRVENVRESRILAESFSASVVDRSNGVIALSGIYDAAAVAEATKTESASVDSAAGVSTNGLPAIDAMKLLWEKASKEDKKEFLKWAFQ